ncbi:hypothetical protein WMF20_45860 [Sorangium sp. So ce834]|uniref:hypothetical protein n=1 Tax=Sorangium sp. So ce834 TaxID=3133321 RepID=UPI003F5E01A1
MSYWYCLDAAQTEQRKEVRRVLMEGSGFTSSFHAVSQSLAPNAPDPFRALTDDFRLNA